MGLRNKFEKAINKWLKRKKVKFKYESERIPYVLARHYIPDFILETSRGKIYVECKGFLRADDRAKLVAVKRQNPSLDLRIVFYSPSKTNIRWAERHGFIYSFETIPEEWLTGGF